MPGAAPLGPDETYTLIGAFNIGPSTEASYTTVATLTVVALHISGYLEATPGGTLTLSLEGNPFFQVIVPASATTNYPFNEDLYVPIPEGAAITVATDGVTTANGLITGTSTAYQ